MKVVIKCQDEQNGFLKVIVFYYAIQSYFYMLILQGVNICPLDMLPILYHNSGKYTVQNIHLKIIAPKKLSASN